MKKIKRDNKNVESKKNNSLIIQSDEDVLDEEYARNADFMNEKNETTSFENFAEGLSERIDIGEGRAATSETDAVLFKNGFSEKNKGSGELTVSVIEPPAAVVVKKPLKVTVFSLFLKALTIKKNKDEDDAIKKLLPVNTLLLFLLIATAAIMFLLFFDLIENKLFVPIFLCYCAFAMPAVLITMHYEFCLKKNVAAFQIFFTFSLGVVLYAVIEAVNSRILSRFIYDGVLNAVFVPVLWGVAELAVLFLIIKIFNVTDLSACVLLAVCIGTGFCFALSLHSLFSSLFLQIEITPKNGVNVGYGILDDDEFLKNSVNALLKEVPLNCIYYPLAFASWSVVIGNVASPLAAYRGAKKDHPFSMYLLLILVIVLYMLCEFEASIGGFDVALKLFCGAVSLFIALRLDNEYLYSQVRNEDD